MTTVVFENIPICMTGEKFVSVTFGCRDKCLSSLEKIFSSKPVINVIEKFVCCVCCVSLKRERWRKKTQSLATKAISLKILL